MKLDYSYVFNGNDYASGCPFSNEGIRFLLSLTAARVTWWNGENRVTLSDAEEALIDECRASLALMASEGCPVFKGLRVFDGVPQSDVVLHSGGAVSWALTSSYNALYINRGAYQLTILKNGLYGVEFVATPEPGWGTVWDFYGIIEKNGVAVQTKSLSAGNPTFATSAIGSAFLPLVTNDVLTLNLGCDTLADGPQVLASKVRCMIAYWGTE